MGYSSAILGEFGRSGHRRRALGVTRGVGAEALQIAVLQRDPRAAAVGGAKVTSTSVTRSASYFQCGVDLPGQQHARRRLPGQHLAPVQLVAVLVALVPAATGAGLDHHATIGDLADGRALGHQLLDVGGEKLEGAGGRAFTATCADGCGAMVGRGFSVGLFVPS